MDGMAVAKIDLISKATHDFALNSRFDVFYPERFQRCVDFAWACSDHHSLIFFSLVNILKAYHHI